MSRPRRDILRMSPDIPAKPWYARKVRVEHLRRLHKLRRKQPYRTLERVIDDALAIGLDALEQQNGHVEEEPVVQAKPKLPPREKAIVPPRPVKEEVADEEFRTCPYCRQEVYYKAYEAHLENEAAYKSDRDAERTSPRQGLGLDDDE